MKTTKQLNQEITQLQTQVKDWENRANSLVAKTLHLQAKLNQILQIINQPLPDIKT